MSFRVSLDVFRGPLDLLLYLVRKHEVEIDEIPIALVADQFLEYLEVLREIDVNAVADFLEMASTLMEIKSRMILPHADETQEPLEDSRHELVRRLLEYKQFKEAASLLEDRGRVWREHFPRLSREPTRIQAEEPIVELELWDLVGAFAKLMQDQRRTKPTSIVYDDTPIHVFMARIHAALIEKGRLAFSRLIEPGMHKSTALGIFLAILELVRHHDVRAEQSETFGEIWILPGDRTESSFAPPSEPTSDPSSAPPRDAISGRK